MFLRRPIKETKVGPSINVLRKDEKEFINSYELLYILMKTNILKESKHKNKDT